MSFLGVIQTVSLVLSLGAIVWAMLLLVMKQARRRRDERHRAARREAVSLMMKALGGEGDLAATVARLKGSPRLLAETLLDFMDAVRGEDRETLLAVLRRSGVDRLMLEQAVSGRRAERLACLEALAAFPGEEAVGVLRATLAARSEEARVLAAQSLVIGGSDFTIRDLLALTEAGRLPRAGRIAQLFRTLTQRSTAEVIAVLEEGAVSAQTKALLIEALGLAGDYAAMRTLMSASGDVEADVRAAAVTALGLLRHPACKSALAAALVDENWKVRARAAAAIAATDLSELADLLVAATEDPVWLVRFEASQALTRLGEAGIQKLRQTAASMLGATIDAAATSAPDRRVA